MKCDHSLKYYTYHYTLTQTTCVYWAVFQLLFRHKNASYLNLGKSRLMSCKNVKPPESRYFSNVCSVRLMIASFVFAFWWFAVKPPAAPGGTTTVVVFFLGILRTLVVTDLLASASPRPSAVKVIFYSLCHVEIRDLWGSGHLVHESLLFLSLKMDSGWMFERPIRCRKETISLL